MKTKYIIYVINHSVKKEFENISISNTIKKKVKNISKKTLIQIKKRLISECFFLINLKTN